MHNVTVYYSFFLSVTPAKKYLYNAVSVQHIGCVMKLTLKSGAQYHNLYQRSAKFSVQTGLKKFKKKFFLKKGLNAGKFNKFIC